LSDLIKRAAPATLQSEVTEGKGFSPGKDQGGFSFQDHRKLAKRVEIQCLFRSVKKNKQDPRSLGGPSRNLSLWRMKEEKVKPKNQNLTERSEVLRGYRKTSAGRADAGSMSARSLMSWNVGGKGGGGGEKACNLFLVHAN